MRIFLQGLAVGVVGMSLFGFLQARSSQPNQASQPPNLPRFVIYGADQTLPMLLDVETGRTWFRQIGAKDSDGNSTGLLWTPVKIVPADTTKYYYRPLAGDIPR